MPGPQNNTFYGSPYPQANQTPMANNNFGGYQNQTMPTQNMQFRQSYIPGRIVASENDIIPNEVPMDGNFGVFVQNDLRKVYAKTWGGDGRIHTNVYELVNEAEPKQDPLQVIMERLDRIEETLKNDYRYSNRSQPRSNPKNNTRRQSREDRNQEVKRDE